MDLLPRLRLGVVVHMHDIFWPNDYPPIWNDRYYSEQYLLAAYLLGDGSSDVKILIPNAFIVHDRDLAEYCKPLMEIAGFRRPSENVSSPPGFCGGSFWMQIMAGR